ncbi:MAG: Dabb family protein [Deltaproteobacteria bacterium]
MIERHIYFKLKDEFANDAGRAEMARALRETLPGIAGVDEIVVGLPADHDSLVWDVALRLRFVSMEALLAWTATPAHQKFTEEFVLPRVEIQKLWNFSID